MRPQADCVDQGFDDLVGRIAVVGNKVLIGAQCLGQGEITRRRPVPGAAKGENRHMSSMIFEGGLPPAPESFPRLRA